MDGMRLVLIFACLVTLPSSVASEDPVLPNLNGPASLEGKVLREPAGEPLKKAIVELIGENQDEGGNYTATSDQDGHFKVAGIHPARYRLFVERTGYIEVDATGSSKTNDVCEYRIGGLLAGKYYVSASPLPNFQSLVPAQKSSDDRA